MVFQGDPGTGTNWNAFTLSRSMLRIERLDNYVMSVVSILYMPYPGKTINYYTDPYGVLELPLKNFVNLNADSGALSLAIYVYETDGTLVDSYSPYVNIFQGISYGEMLAPRKKDTPLLSYEYRHDLILPPNVMIFPNVYGQMYAPLFIESNAHIIDGDAIWEELSSGSWIAITPSGDRSNTIASHAYADALRLTTGKDHHVVRIWNYDKPDVCTDLVCIRWTSLTGCVRQHYFHIVGFINSTDKEVSIVEAGNGYDVRKNAYKGIHCRLTGLTAYSCWYYQDLLQALDAHAIVNQTYATFATEMESMETACHVTGGMEESPNGNGFYNFDFIVKLRHYDTV